MTEYIQAPVDCDLTSTMLEQAWTVIRESGDRPHLLVGDEHQIAELAKCKVFALIDIVALPHKMFAREGWALVGNRVTYWSPGA